MHKLLPAAALLLTLAAATPASAAVRAPDLRAVKVQAAGFAHLGGPLPVRVTVAVGAGRGRATNVRVYLSKDRRRSKDDARLSAAGRVGAPQRRRRSETAEIRATLPAAMEAGPRFVVACVDDPGRLREPSERNNCRAAGAAVTIAAAADPARTSQALIEADRASGKLSAERALTYRVFAVTGDPRLPARYAGDATPEEDHGVFREIADAWPGLSKAARRALAPNLVPPSVRTAAGTSSTRASAAQDEEEDAGTCVRLGADVTWKSVTAAGGKVRIHWDPERPQDGAHAAEYAAAMTTAYARFKQIMGVEPISDAKGGCYHGEDGALDIYFDDGIRGADAYTIPAHMTSKVTPVCDGYASFIVSRPQSVSFTMPFVLAHELFHAFQNVFPEKAGCRDGLWLAEASANWGAHAVFPADDSEHFFKRLMEAPGTPLDERDYHAWPFFLWMEKTFGERSIRTTYQGLKSSPSMVAVDRAIGGFRKGYLDFARAAWNQAPMPVFSDWDRFAPVPLGPTYRPLEPVHLLLAGMKKRTANVPVDARERGREYHPFTITDEKLREVVFRNPRAGDADFRAGAIVTLQSGAVRFDDWSEKKTVRYCRDAPGQDIASLVVVYANASLAADRRITDNPELGLRDQCEGLPWHFKVLSASLKTHAIGGKTASGDHLCASLGALPIEGQTTFTAATSDPEFSLENDVSLKSGGALAGEITVLAPARFEYDTKGCEGIDTGDPITTCARAFGRNAGGNGAWEIGFSFDAPSKDAENATLTWALSSPSVGFVDATDEVCNVQEIWHGLSPGRNEQQVPLAKLAGTEPVTLTFTGDSQFGEDQYGKPATLAYDWTYSMVVQRVDETGAPL